MKLLDTITFSCGKVCSGIIDYITPHHYIFYEITDDTPNVPQITELIINWRAGFHNIRWSAFLDICGVDIGYPKLITKSIASGRAFDPKTLDKSVTRISRKHLSTVSN